MATPADTFQKASFDGIAFPYVNISIKGGLRHHVHEFPHSPGGEVEKMGRRLYSITMRAFFHDVPDTYLDAEYPDLYPARLGMLVSRFEQEKTASLVIPNVGTIQACAVEWSQTFDVVQALTGEAVEIQFLEDQDRENIFDADFSATTLDRKTYMLMGFVGTTFPEPPSIFQVINDVVTQIQALAGIADASSRLLEAKLLEVANLCSQAERLTELQDPSNFRVVQALKEVWLAANDLNDNLLSQGATIASYLVPKQMSVGQIAFSLYGTAEKGVELMDLNPIEDPLSIPAGTTLRYYRAA